MSINNEHCGLFGKLPQQADFVSHHLHEDFTEYWHSWLQSSMSISREQLGEDWLNYYLTSPIWHFAMSPGICYTHAVTGVIIPSMDEVGRYFPLTLAHAGNHLVWDAYLNGQDWYDAVEKTLISALDENTAYTKLVDSLESLETPDFQGLPEYQTQTSLTGFDKSYMIPASDDLDRADMLTGLLDKTYTRLLGNYSLWWTKGSEYVEPCLLVSSNLPAAGQFAAMFDGDWQQWGWSLEQVITSDTNESPDMEMANNNE